MPYGYNIFYPRRRLYFQDENPLLAPTDDSGFIYSRDRALIVIEKLLSFYNSITELQIDEFNLGLEKQEGKKASLCIGLNETLYENRQIMGEIKPKRSKQE